MNRLNKLFLIVLVFSVFLGSIPMVYAVADDACACCSSSCRCEVYICHVSCAGAATIGRGVFSPHLELFGLLAALPQAMYEYKPIYAVFHPPNRIL